MSNKQDAHVHGDAISRISVPLQLPNLVLMTGWDSNTQRAPPPPPDVSSGIFAGTALDDDKIKKLIDAVIKSIKVGESQTKTDDVKTVETVTKDEVGTSGTKSGNTMEQKEAIQVNEEDDEKVKILKSKLPPSLAEEVQE